MRIARLHTSPEKGPFDGLRFRSETGEDWQEYIVPHTWSRPAIEVLIAKAFCKDALPALTRKAPEAGMPEWLWRSEIDDAGLDNISAEWRYRHERDIREVLKRVAGGLTYKAWKAGVFEGEDDARAFHDELIHAILHKKIMLETALLAATGLDWAYGVPAKQAACRQTISSFGKSASGGIAIGLREGGKDLFSGIRKLYETASSDAAVMLPAENAASLSFIGIRRQKDIDAAATDLGRKMLAQAVHLVIDAVDRTNARGFEPSQNPKLAEAVQAARDAGVSENFIALAIEYARQGYEEISLSPENPTYDDVDVSVKTVLSVPDHFIESALTNHGFMVYEGAAPLRHVSASKLFDRVCESLWQSGDPGIFFRDAVLGAAPFLSENGMPGASASGGYVFLPDTQAPSGTISLAAFHDFNGVLNIPALTHAATLLTVALDAAQAEASWRPVSLCLTDVSAFLMAHALPYDSEEGRAAAGLAAAIVSGAAHLASAKMASRAGAFSNYGAVEKSFLQSVKDKMAFLSGTAYMQRGAARRHWQVKTGFFPSLASAAKDLWEEAYNTGRTKGFRNAHLSAIDGAMDVQALLGAQTHDIVPEKNLVRFEGYFPEAEDAVEIYGKKLNPCVPKALLKLGYDAAKQDDIHFYAVGHGTLFDAPHINHVSLKRMGFHQAALDALEAGLRTAQHIRYVFNKWTLGEDFCRHMLGFSAEDLASSTFDMLEALGFTQDEIEEANLYCCGAMTLEGAPHLDPRHLAVFDCAALLTPLCVRRVSAQAQIRMQAAVEPFLSGAVAQVIELDHFTGIDDVQKLVLLAWEAGIKQLRIYRQGSSLLHPVLVPQALPESENNEEEAVADKAPLSVA